MVSTVDAIMITAVLTVYALTVYSVVDVRNKVAHHNIVRLVTDRAERKLGELIKLLGFSREVRREGRNRLLKFFRSELALFITAYSALTAAVLLKGSIAAAAGLVVILMLLAAASKKAIDAEVIAEKYVRFRGFRRDVELRVRVGDTVRVTVCDDIDESTTVLEGDICTEATVPGGGEVILNYKALSLSSYISRRVLLKLHHPVYLLPTYKVVNAEVRVARDELPKADVTITSRKSVRLREPSVDSVRSYAVGDDLRLVVAKSILYSGGLRTKVLELGREPSVYDVGFTDTVALVPGSYICSYLMGYLQLLQLLKVLEGIGVRRVSIGGVGLSISEVSDPRRFRTLCKRAGPHALGSSLAIVSPDLLGELAVHDGLSGFNTVVILEPVMDTHLRYSRYSEAVSRWVSELRQELDKYIPLLRKRNVRVVVFTHGG